MAAPVGHDVPIAGIPVPIRSHILSHTLVEDWGPKWEPTNYAVQFTTKRNVEDLISAFPRSSWDRVSGSDSRARTVI